MQMQMDQLLALQIEQQQQLAAIQQQMVGIKNSLYYVNLFLFKYMLVNGGNDYNVLQGPDKPKPKRKRKKRKSQAEREAEDQQQQQQQQLLVQQQQMQQNAMVGNLPITSQQQPNTGAFGGLWHHRPGVQQHHVMPNVRPQMTVQSRPMFSMPGQTFHTQSSGSGVLPTNVVQVRHTGPTTNVISSPSPMGQMGYNPQMAASKTVPLFPTHHQPYISSATTVVTSLAVSGPIVTSSVTHSLSSSARISTTAVGATATNTALQAVPEIHVGPEGVSGHPATAMTPAPSLSQQSSTVPIVNAISMHQMQYSQVFCMWDA